VLFSLLTDAKVLLIELRILYDSAGHNGISSEQVEGWSHICASDINIDCNAR